MDVRSATPARPLDYAAISPTRRLTRRTAVLLLVAGAALLAGWIAWDKRPAINAYLLQRAALAAAPVPGTVVYRDTAPGDPRHTPELASSNQPLGQLAGSALPLQRQQSVATLFVGRMTTPGGIERVVAVEVERYAGMEHGGMALRVIAVAFQPASFFRPASQFVREVDRSEYGWMNGVTETAQVTAATPDPADSSHIWFDFSLGEQTVTYDVWLRDPRNPGGDLQILIQPRQPIPPDGPLTREKWFRL